MEDQNYGQGYGEEQPVREVNIRRTLDRDPNVSVIHERINVDEAGAVGGPAAVERDIVIPQYAQGDRENALDKSIAERQVENEDQAFESYLAATGKSGHQRSRGVDEMYAEMQLLREKSDMAATVRAAHRADPELLVQDYETDIHNYSDEDLQVQLESMRARTSIQGEEVAALSTSRRSEVPEDHRSLVRQGMATLQQMKLEAQQMIPEEELDEHLAYLEAENYIKMLEDLNTLKEREQAQFQEQSQVLNQTIADQAEFEEEYRYLKAEHETKIATIDNLRQTLQKPNLLKSPEAAEDVQPTDEEAGQQEPMRPRAATLGGRKRVSLGDSQIHLFVPGKKRIRKSPSAKSPPPATRRPSRSILRHSLGSSKQPRLSPIQGVSPRSPQAEPPMQVQPSPMYAAAGEPGVARPARIRRPSAPAPARLSQPSPIPRAGQRVRPAGRQLQPQAPKQPSPVVIPKGPAAQIEALKARATEYYEEQKRFVEEQFEDEGERELELEFLQAEYEAKLEHISEIVTLRDQAKQEYIQDYQTAKREITDKTLLKERLNFLKDEYINKLAYIQETKRSPPKPKKLKRRLSFVQTEEPVPVKMTAEQRAELMKKYTKKLPPRPPSAGPVEPPPRFSTGPSQESLPRMTAEELAELKKKYTKKLPPKPPSAGPPPPPPPRFSSGPSRPSVTRLTAEEMGQLKQKYTVKLPPRPPGAPPPQRRATIGPSDEDVRRKLLEGRAERMAKYTRRLPERPAYAPPPRPRRATIGPSDEDVRKQLLESRAELRAKYTRRLPERRPSEGALATRRPSSGPSAEDIRKQALEDRASRMAKYTMKLTPRPPSAGPERRPSVPSTDDLRRQQLEARAERMARYTKKLPPRLPGAPPPQRRATIGPSDEDIRRQLLEGRAERMAKYTRRLPERPPGEEPPRRRATIGPSDEDIRRQLLEGRAERMAKYTKKLPPRPPSAGLSRIPSVPSADDLRRQQLESRAERMAKYTKKLPPRPPGAPPPQRRVTIGPSDEDIRRQLLENRAELRAKYTRRLPMPERPPGEEPPHRRATIGPSDEDIRRQLLENRAELRAKYTRRLPPRPPSAGPPVRRPSAVLSAEDIRRQTLEERAELMAKYTIKIPTSSVAREDAYRQEVLQKRIHPEVEALKLKTQNDYKAQVAEAKEAIEDILELNENLRIQNEAYRTKMEIIDKLNEVKPQVASRFIRELKNIDNLCEDEETKQEMREFLRAELNANIDFMPDAVCAEPAQTEPAEQVDYQAEPAACPVRPAKRPAAKAGKAVKGAKSGKGPGGPAKGPAGPGKGPAGPPRPGKAPPGPARAAAGPARAAAGPARVAAGPARAAAGPYRAAGAPGGPPRGPPGKPPGRGPPEDEKARKKDEKAKMKKWNVPEKDILKLKKKVENEVETIRKITKDNKKTVEIVSAAPPKPDVNVTEEDLKPLSKPMNIRGRKQVEKVLGEAKLKSFKTKVQMDNLPPTVAKTLAKRGLEELAKSAIEKEGTDEVYKAIMLEKSGVDFKDDPKRVVNLIVPSDGPKLNLVGNALESVSEGVITEAIPTAEINALDPIATEEVALTLSVQPHKPPEEGIAKRLMADQKVEIVVQEPSLKNEYFECEVLLDTFNVENYFQAKGTALPKWFPGFFTAFPGEKSVVMEQKSPSNVLLTAWHKLQPEYEPPQRE